MISPEQEAVLSILRDEPIRAIDGRYSAGFADIEDAQALVALHLAHIEKRQGFSFFVIGPGPEEAS